MIAIVVAMDLDRVIGREGKLPWEGELPADLAHFQRLTMQPGNVVIMGRRTYESIPADKRPLEGRINIVLSNGVDIAGGCWVVDSLPAALMLADELGSGDIFVIGGESVYREAWPMVDRIYATVIEHTFAGDRRFPEIKPDEWQITGFASKQQDESNRYDLQFIVYDRKRVQR